MKKLLAIALVLVMAMAMMVPAMAANGELQLTFEEETGGFVGFMAANGSIGIIDPDDSVPVISYVLTGLDGSYKIALTINYEKDNKLDKAVSGLLEWTDENDTVVYNNDKIDPKGNIKLTTLSFTVIQLCEAQTISFKATLNNKDGGYVASVEKDVEIPGSGHSPGVVADCINDQICEVCNEILVGAFGHTAGEEIVTLQPTCTENGAWEIRCDVCNYILDEGKIDKLGHKPGERTTTLFPTCTEKGAWEIHCEVCYELLDSGVLDELGHKPGEQIETGISSCTGAGSWEIRCIVCEALIESGTVAALGHTPGEKTVTLQPTCTGKGAWEIRCDVCGVIIKTGKITALGHTPGEKTVTKEAALGVKGAWEIRCDVCGVVLETGEIDAIKVISASGAKFISILPENGKSNSKVWVLTFNVTAKLSNGAVETLVFSVDLNGNNANLDGSYKFGAGHALSGYTLTYDIKGNGSNIKAFSIK